MSQSDENIPTFEIALVMAGTISAGAYTAGVVDFLLEALSEWEKARKCKNPLCPPHRVVIRVLSGSSGGGIAAGMMAAARGHETSQLRKKWVEEIDIVDLLQSRDLAGRHAVAKSVFDSTKIEEIADEVFELSDVKTFPPWVSDPLHIYLTVTNVRGIPYNVPFAGSEEPGHGMSLHADYTYFILTNSAEETPSDAVVIQPFKLDHKNWHALKKATIATGAFPLGLAPRVLSKNKEAYDDRPWRMPGREKEEKKEEAKAKEKGKRRHFIEYRRIAPYWPKGKPPASGELPFVAMDGGVLNNEPFGFAHRALAGKDGTNPREPEKAKRAVIMVDPFPDVHPFSWNSETKVDIVSAAKGLVDSLLNQAVFKLDELKLAQEEDVYSRFLITPKREDEQYPIASGSLCGFGGFLSKAFREHDYQLGRRNCQRFLDQHFAIPKDARNPIFKVWNDSRNSDELDEAHSFEKDGTPFRRIIPLIGKASQEQKLREWPRYSRWALARLQLHVYRRALRLLPKLGVQTIGITKTMLLTPLVLLLSTLVARFAASKVQGNLRKRQLL